MTWTARATVQDVSDGPAPIDVLAVANADEMVKPYANDPTTSEATRQLEVPALVSNTEGKIRSVEIKLVLDEDSTSLKPGDVIQLSGHFTG